MYMYRYQILAFYEHEHTHTQTGRQTLRVFRVRFTAYQFFNEKQKIAEVMRDSLNQYFSKVRNGISKDGLGDLVIGRAEGLF